LLAHVFHERNETTSWLYYYAVNPDRLQDTEHRLIRATLKELG
jgi:hypothetical protein